MPVLSTPRPRAVGAWGGIPTLAPCLGLPAHHCLLQWCIWEPEALEQVPRWWPPSRKHGTKRRWT